MKADVVAKPSCQIIIKNNALVTKSNLVKVLITKNIKIEVKNLGALEIVYENITLPVVLEIGDSTRLNLVEIYQGKNDFKKEVIMHNNCQVDLLLLNQALTLNQTSHFNIHKNSDLKMYVCNLENGNTTQKMHFNLLAWNAKVEGMFGTITSLSDEMDFEIYCHHQNKQTYSDIKNFGIAKDKSFYRFNIWGIIKEKMDEVETHQKQKILVFNPEVKLETNPYLIINHNNVKASHGVAIGKINEQHLFYLKTRGIDNQAAKKLIVWGYFLPLILKINNPHIQNIVRGKIQERIKSNV